MLHLLILALVVGLIISLTYLVIKRQTTSITGWRVWLSVLIMTGFSLISNHYQFTLFQILLSLPISYLLIFSIIRVILGTFPSTFHDVRKKNKTIIPKRFRLVAMPINHFGEKVRWCMDLIDAPYEEMTVGGILSMTFRSRTVPWLVDIKSNSIIGNSDEILMYLSSVYVPTLTGTKYKLAQQLLTRNEITMSWEDELNQFGHAIQGWAYHYLLGNPHISSIYTLRAWGAYEPRVSLMERFLLHAIHPFVKIAMTSSLDLQNLKSHQIRYEIIISLLNKVDLYFQNHPSSLYLTGESLSYVDIIFCSLTAPLLFFTLVSPTPNSRNQKSFYAKNRFQSFLFTTQEEFTQMKQNYPSELLKFEEELLKRPCGQFVERMYREHRWDVFK